MIFSLYLENFRNYKKKEFLFSPGINWVVGPNAMGKTNLLEALFLLSTGRSFRTPHLSELIIEGAERFYLEVHFQKDGIDQSLALSFDGQSKQMQHNTTRYEHFTPLIGLLPIVVLLPEDSALVWGAPACRRRFLNLHIAQASPLYVQHLMRYHRALSQRNALLRRKTTVAIEPWEEIMAQSGALLMEMRAKAVEELSLPLQEMLEKLSGGNDALTCAYQGSFSLDSPKKLSIYLKEEWQKQRNREMQLGTTLMGPHRDDLKLMIGKKPAKIVASEGQKHSIAASLRLSEWQRLKGLTECTPLFCIDDFGVHLDAERKERLLEEIQGLGQVFLTAPTSISEETLSLLSSKE